MKRLCCALLCLCGWAQAESPRSLVKEGNGQYAAGHFPDAEASYRKALEKVPASLQAQFDLGNALYKQGRFEEAAKAFEAVAHGTRAKALQAQALYNLGNAQLKAKQTKEAVASYIESLKLRPKDEDTKYNLSYALAQEQQKQDKNQDKNKDKKDQKQDQKQGQDKQNQDKQNQDKQKQDKQQDQKPQDQKPQEQQQQGQDKKDQKQDGQNGQDAKDQKQQQDGKPQERKMSKQEAERILDVIRDSDRETRKKLKARPGARPKTDKDW